MTALLFDSAALLDLNPFVAIHGAHELATAIDPGREEDDSRAVPPGVEVFHPGCDLGRCYADTHPTSKES